MKFAPAESLLAPSFQASAGSPDGGRVRQELARLLVTLYQAGRPSEARKYQAVAVAPAPR